MAVPTNRKVSARELRRELKGHGEIVEHGLVPSVTALLDNEKRLIAELEAVSGRIGVLQSQVEVLIREQAYVQRWMRQRWSARFAGAWRRVVRYW